MRILFASSMILAIALGWGCSGPTGTAQNTPTTPAVDLTATPKVIVVEPTANIDLPPATANKIAQGDTIGNRANRPPRLDANPNGTPAPLQFRPAAEDSEIAVTMAADGRVVETRVFKSHPKLARVQAIWSKADAKTLKFTMRNGQTIEVKTNRLGNLQSATTNELLKIAGR